MPVPGESNRIKAIIYDTSCLSVLRSVLDRVESRWEPIGTFKLRVPDQGNTVPALTIRSGNCRNGGKKYSNIHHHGVSLSAILGKR